MDWALLSRPACSMMDFMIWLRPCTGVTRKWSSFLFLSVYRKTAFEKIENYDYLQKLYEKSSPKNFCFDLQKILKKGKIVKMYNGSFFGVPLFCNVCFIIAIIFR